MKYQEAREKIAEVTCPFKRSYTCAECVYFGSITIYPCNNPKIAQILKALLSPQQIRAWKDGGELVVTDPDQSLPHLINTESIHYRTQAFHDGVEAGQESMTGFRKVVAPQSEEVGK